VKEIKMSQLAWTYNAWGSRFPSLSTDEFARHTLVLPNPFKVAEVDNDGTKYHPALVLVIAPWWMCRQVFSAEYRETTRRERQIAKRDSEELLYEIEQAPPTDPEAQQA
jgi:hypothetical protein